MENVTIYRDREIAGQYGWSPFVCKLEARLRFSQVRYSVRGGNPTRSPKGKLPYATITSTNAEGGSELISDSALIIQRLIEMGMAKDINQNLTSSHKATDLAIRALLEDKLYFMTTRERWTENFYIMRDLGPLSSIPYPVRLVIAYIVYSKITRTLFGQGMGRYTEDEFQALYEETWTSLDELIAANGRKGRSIPWLLGQDGPSDADASLFGFLAGVMTSPANPKAQAIIKKLPHLQDYVDKVHDKYFPDYEKPTLKDV